MPSQEGRKTLLRLLTLLRLVSANTGQKTAADLAKTLAAKGFEPKRRTIERDLRILESIGIVRCNRKGKPHGWTFNASTSFVIPGIGVPEALSLTLLRDFLERMLPLALWRDLKPRLDLADRALKSEMGNRIAARWAEKVRYVTPDLPLVPPEIDEGILEAVQDALLNDLQLEVEYRAVADDKPKAMTLNPLAIVQRGSVGYLIATAWNYPDLRPYAIHRINKAEACQTKPARRPEGFSLDDYLTKEAGALFPLGSGRTIKLRARVNHDLARVLKETMLSKDQTLRPIEATEDSLLTATLPDTLALRWWVLSQGTRMEVLAPNRLRDGIAYEIAELNRTYRKKREKNRRLA